MTRPRRSLPAAVLAAAVVVVLTGCTPPADMPTPEPESPTSSSSASPPPGSAPPVPVFDGTAEQNLAFFDLTNRQLIDSGAELDGQAFVTNLEAAGYPRSAMEVTPDETSIGLDADNIQFSIRLGETCLIGQWGNVGYASMTAEVLSTGRCLIGTARPA